MKKNLSACFGGLALLAALTIPLHVSAQQPRYKLIDLGTLGGPASSFSNGNDGILNNRGTAVGWAETSAPDPFAPFCMDADCFLPHAFKSQRGVVTDLGALTTGVGSYAAWITANGVVVGASENGQLDPLVPGLPQSRGVIWKDGAITDLGTLPEGGYESVGLTANDHGHVVGFGLNTIPDTYSLAAPGFFPTQTRAFVWREGTMKDLGTLGGNDAAAFFVNDRGQVTGQSYINATPNSTTGLPTADSFFWEKGRMYDIGSLGGTVGNPSSLNNRGQVVGISNMAGDLTSHPFLWSKKYGLQDLGTLGGENGAANWINGTGDIAGKADLPGPAPQNHDAVLWRKNGTEMIDLGVLPGDACANAYFVNSGGQVVGTSESSNLCRIPTGEHAFLWENGGPMLDLNSLIPAGSSLELTFAFAINDEGQIAGIGVPPGCTPDNIGFCGHAYMLIPCNADAGECSEDSTERVFTPPARGAVRERSREARSLPVWRRNNHPESSDPGTSAISALFRPDLVSGPGAVLEPAKLMFPTQLVGTTSTPQSVLLHNSGTITLSITGITATGDFTETNTCGSSLAPGADCTINVGFEPAQGGPLTGKLSVRDDASGSPQTVSLTGTGTVVELAPTLLKFACHYACHLVLGCHCYCSGGETTMLTNVGHTALDITDVMISGPFSLGNACRANVGPGQSCGLTVDWKRITGVGEISISDNGGASPQTVHLWGVKYCTP